MTNAASWPKLRADDSWRGRSIEERARAIASACQTAMEILRGSPDSRARLLRADPVPPSTRQLLRRLAAGE